MLESMPSEFQPEVISPVQERVRLREDIEPINRQMVDVAQENNELEDIREEMEEDGLTHWVDFEGGDLEKLEKEGFKHAGLNSYLISPISDRDWFSDHYFDCTGVVAIGRDIETNKEISFLTHQDPGYFIDGGGRKGRDIFRGLKSFFGGVKGKITGRYS
jgi:hypothetical protein